MNSNSNLNLMWMISIKMVFDALMEQNVRAIYVRQEQGRGLMR